MVTLGAPLVNPSPFQSPYAGAPDRMNRRRASAKKGLHTVILIELTFDTSLDQHENVAELARQTMAATQRETGAFSIALPPEPLHADRAVGE